MQLVNTTRLIFASMLSLAPVSLGASVLKPHRSRIAPSLDVPKATSEAKWSRTKPSQTGAPEEIEETRCRSRDLECAACRIANTQICRAAPLPGPVPLMYRWNSPPARAQPRTAAVETASCRGPYLWFSQWAMGWREMRRLGTSRETRLSCNKASEVVGRSSHVPTQSSCLPLPLPRRTIRRECDSHPTCRHRYPSSGQAPPKFMVTIASYGHPGEEVWSGRDLAFDGLWKLVVSRWAMTSGALWIGCLRLCHVPTVVLLYSCQKGEPGLPFGINISIQAAACCGHTITPGSCRKAGLGPRNG